MVTKLLTPAGPLARRLVYLDTADWSKLEDGELPEAEAALRAAGERGTAAYVVSPEHFVEVTGLTYGQRGRLEYMRDFPATLWIDVRGEHVLQHEAAVLAATSLGTAAPTAQFQADWLVGVSDERVTASLCRACRSAKVYSKYATAETASRKARAGGSQPSPEKFLDLVLRRDSRKLARWLKKHDFIRPGVHGYAQRLLLHGAEKGIHLAQVIGLYPAVNRNDPIFDRVVACRLPPEIRNSRTRVSEVYRAWQDEHHRVQRAPSLSTVAALERANYRQLAGAYKQSDALDMMHAAFAPLCHVFTCDKRNHRPIQSTLKRAGTATTVVNTGRATELAAAIESIAHDDFTKW